MTGNTTARNTEAAHEPRFTVAAVARRLGVAPATLRTWDRRYGLGPTMHAVGAHRRYSAADLARLEAMRRFVLAGVPPAEAASLVKESADVATVTQFPVTEGEQLLPGALGQLSGAVEPIQAPPEADHGALAGGRGLALPKATRELRGLARAVMALDAPSMQQTLENSITSQGVAWTWHELLRPILVALGMRWQSTGEGVEAEHLLSEVAHNVFATKITSLSRATGGRPILLSCTPEEQHTLPLVVLGAALAEQDLMVRLLGRGLPADSLIAAVRRIGPAVLVLWAQVPETADLVLLSDIPITRPPTTVLVAGAGWQDIDLPARVSYVPDLDNAVRLIRLAAVG